MAQTDANLLLWTKKSAYPNSLHDFCFYNSLHWSLRQESNPRDRISDSILSRKIRNDFWGRKGDSMAQLKLYLRQLCCGHAFFCVSPTTPHRNDCSSNCALQIDIRAILHVNYHLRTLSANRIPIVEKIKSRPRKSKHNFKNLRFRIMSTHIHPDMTDRVTKHYRWSTRQ